MTVGPWSLTRQAVMPMMRRVVGRLVSGVVMVPLFRRDPVLEMPAVVLVAFHS